MTVYNQQVVLNYLQLICLYLYKIILSFYNDFSLKDLIVINRLLKIELSDLIPTFLAQSDQARIRTSIDKLDNPKLKLSQDDFALV